MSDLARKICLVGDFSVGKTSLIRRFVDGQFSDEYLSTVGVKLSRKVAKLPQPTAAGVTDVELLIWDIEGQTQFKAIAPSYLQGSKGAIIVADVKRPETVKHLHDHLDLFFSVNKTGSIIIAFNKVDLLSAAQLTELQAEYSFRDRPQVIATYTTSAKTGDNVNRIFQELAADMIKVS
ncbi:MAG: GTP-binding protein [Spirulinaceae cyanobacterium RM2_2_10]|nr:GTP-binding protein [Spirulinaceae cyanobacterium SM2_1_0]NJO20739.1 GTP-binding protein [Spirulinaceae cyanobacterium RM2_2_10]